MPHSLNWDVSTPLSYEWFTNPLVLSTSSRFSKLSKPMSSSCIYHHMPYLHHTKKIHEVEYCDEYGTLSHSNHYKCLECQHIKKPCKPLPTKFIASALALSHHKDELGNDTPLDNDLNWDVHMWTHRYKHWVHVPSHITWHSSGLTMHTFCYGLNVEFICMLDTRRIP